MVKVDAGPSIATVVDTSAGTVMMDTVSEPVADPWGSTRTV
jgi:hypothetical protein